VYKILPPFPEDPPHRTLPVRIQDFPIIVLFKIRAHPAASRQDRAIRSNSSDLPMQILRDFRFYPLRGFAAGTASFFGNTLHVHCANITLTQRRLRQRSWRILS
jgi:hypothetical protein